MANQDVERGRGEGKSGGYAGGVPDYFAVDREESFWTPWIVPMFVVANVVMFLVTMYVNNCPDHPRIYGGCVAGGFLRRFSFQPLRENPLLGPSSATLVKLGALEWSEVVREHQGWRLVTCPWLHAGLIHLITNMLSLLFHRDSPRAAIGFGLGGSVFSSLFIRGSISVGASGALFGLLGAMLAELLTNWTIYTNKAEGGLTGVVPVFGAGCGTVLLSVIILINLAIGILPRVDNFAHIGGFLSGFLLGFVFLLRPQFAAGLAMLFSGVNANKHCSWCRYLNCVPTSKWQCDY
ncbi:unnamed protein product [Spirodela intermedia]|uniref:RHOMBOID-like protein n=1 Tax=Spirodela intermedia TaxID=51605 RepID=A0A7I8IHJ7_SPIIN|nr:unnamed protein product [Spirodela intermedia]CAA6656322.1 unnamed protein product [Spirodela intermedia]